ncbi:Pachytene checkpoint protein 2 like protein [Nosema granulosis]|uniref:Pachytene checkpoint protein 2 like protein n=1 Tax=Nosema granulosis TaxID=83296 RepID=A0A9P6GYL9_9MICR|nr:Pachytene checkpoint protein 2 like protein [Nosema granulosis]
MQVVEVCETKHRNLSDEMVEEKIKDIKTRQGKVNNIRLCETHGSKDFQIEFSGEIDDAIQRKIKIFRYSLFKDTKSFEHFTTLKMPTKKYETFFDDLVMDNSALMKSLEHFYKVLHYQATKVDVSYFNITKAILVYGPPGTGKSTLSRAVFQRLSIRMSKDTYLVELNASKIFTRYYGDTTGALSKILNGLEELSKTTTIFVAIDEIETLFMDRSVILENNEPLEGIRVVNTLLLFMDTLKYNKNMFVIFTSNFYSHLDPAFVDRCDISLMTSLPNEKTSYSILSRIFKKMMDKNLLEYEDIPDYEDVPNTSIIKAYLSIKNQSPRKIKKIVFHNMPLRKTTVDFLCSRIAKFKNSESQKDKKL